MAYWEISTFKKTIAMTPQELQKNPPRDILYTDELFAKNRKKVKGIITGSFFIIPVVALLSWWKFDDLISGIYWGIGICGLGELMGLGMMMNAKKAVSICRDGILTTGTIQKTGIYGNTGKYTTAESAGYIMYDVIYKEKLGTELKGKAMFIGSKGEVTLKEGDQVPVLYLQDKPGTFIIYNETLGISAIGRAK